MSEIELTQFIKSYWNYFIELEDQLLASSDDTTAAVSRTAFILG